MAQRGRELEGAVRFLLTEAEVVTSPEQTTLPHVLPCHLECMSLHLVVLLFPLVLSLLSLSHSVINQPSSISLITVI